MSGCRGDFTIFDNRNPILTEEWIYSEENSNSNKIVFLGYDANLMPLPNFSGWKNDRTINKALEATKGFDGEVYLDDVKIK